MTSVNLDHPLRFERIFLEKVWGGRALERAPGLALPDGMQVGETWEVVDREREQSVVSDRDGSPLAGRTLGELVDAHADQLLGSAPRTPGGRFPLLVKYIDASQDLSIQVHPDDASAARVGGGAEGKTEAWVVLAAEPGALVYCGLRADVDRATFEARATEPGAEELLQAWPVKAGDCITVLGGTVHAIGAGVTLLEVQQNSDTTYRIYDWGRMGLDGRPRETHVEAALAVTTFGEKPHPPVSAGSAGARGHAQRLGDTATIERLSQTDYFAIDLLDVRGRTALGTDGERFAIDAVLEGRGTLESRGGNVALAPGDTFLLPASLGAHAFVPDEGEALRVVRMTSTQR